MAATLPATAAAAPGARPMQRALHWGLTALASLALLWTVFRTHLAGEPLWAVGLLCLGGLAIWIYASARQLAWKYLFPGVAGMGVFVLLPLLYTVQLGFTNYSSAHLLTEERARDYLLAQTETDEASLMAYRVVRAANGHRIELQALDQPEATRYGTAVIDLTAGAPAAPVAAQPLTPPDTGAAGAAGTTATAAAEAVLDMRALIALRPALQRLQISLPDGRSLQYAGLREFGRVTPVWEALPEGGLKQRATGQVFTPDRDTGYFTSSSGETLTPGFRVGIGWVNYSRMLGDADFRGPFVSIFIWTVTFAGLTVLFSTALGLALAVALNWEGLRFRTAYRTLLFLPYAVPGFISILVFKGLFNQNFGEINAILDALFGIRPAWFADPLLAKVMILIVNTWLGYPYIMVLATGLIKAIPADLYEASAIAGAGPWTNFRRITAPLIAKPLAPLLIAAFAFNFNNFVLISLLTDGRPDYLNTKLPAGTTDILVSYTYRIAFTDAGQNFGLAAAISTLIFVMVALMALLQLRFMRGEGSHVNR